jgi:hypothetical protein
MLVMLVASAASAREPYRPVDDDEVLLRLNYREDPEMSEVWAARKAMRDAPGELTPALEFARRAIEVGRQRADPRFMSYAEAAIGPWNQAEPPLEVRVIRATLAQHRHHFDAATADLDAVLVNAPRHAQARLTRAVIKRVRGTPKEALRDCAALVGTASPLVVATCVADSASLGRDPDSALALLQTEIDRAPSAPLSERRWALTVRAEIAERLGRAETEDHYLAALALGSRERHDPYLLNAYADFLLELGRDAEVRALLLPHATLDDALLRLAIAETRLLPEQPELKAVLEARRNLLETRFEMSRRRGDTPHQRELARFLLDVKGDAVAALPVALNNWASQREPADALLVLEASAAVGDTAAAAPVREWLDDTGLEDRRIAQRLATP